MRINYWLEVNYHENHWVNWGDELGIISRILPLDQSAGEILIDAAQRLKKKGADFLLICTNTMHKLAGDIQQNISLPLLHIADATGLEIKKRNIKKIGLLGTKFTMEQDFYKGRLKDRFGFEVLIPDAADRQVVHDVIYQELCLGIISHMQRKI